MFYFFIYTVPHPLPVLYDLFDQNVCKLLVHWSGSTLCESTFIIHLKVQYILLFFIHLQISNKIVLLISCHHCRPKQIPLHNVKPDNDPKQSLPSGPTLFANLCFIFDKYICNKECIKVQRQKLQISLFFFHLISTGIFLISPQKHVGGTH